MSGMEELAKDYDTEEHACVELAEKRDRARTFVGRWLADFRLRGHEKARSQMTDEFDVIAMHAPETDQSLMR